MNNITKMNKCYDNISRDIFGETLYILSMNQTHEFVYNAQ
jgi:hypothetical protein